MYELRSFFSEGYGWAFTLVATIKALSRFFKTNLFGLRKQTIFDPLEVKWILTVSSNVGFRKKSQAKQYNITTMLKNDVFHNTYSL